MMMPQYYSKLVIRMINFICTLIYIFFWLNRVGGCVLRGQVVGRGSCLFEDKKKKDIYILAPSVLGPNLQLPAHELISPNSFYDGNLSFIIREKQYWTKHRPLGDSHGYM